MFDSFRLLASAIKMAFRHVIMSSEAGPVFTKE